MNSFKVVKAYLAKKAQEPIPDSPERRKALDFLQRNSALVSEYFEKGLITKEEALPFVLEHLKKDPFRVNYYFKNGLITKEEVLPFVLDQLKQNPYYVESYFIGKFITKEEARPFALENVKKDPYCVRDYLGRGILTREEARSCALERLEQNPYYVDYYFVNELITREEARPFALRNAERQPAYVDSYFTEGLITREEALPFALKIVKENPSELDRYRRVGILTKQDVNDFLSGHLSTDVNDFNHAHTLNLEILQKLRSLAKKGGGNITLDKVPQLKKFFSGKPSLSVADIDKMIAREQHQNKHNAYSFDHNIWGKGEMQNSFEQDQLIIKVSALPKALQSEIDSKEHLKKFMAYVKESTAKHPSPYGWARVHVKSPGVWIIDEIQSDVVSVARLAFREDIPEGLEGHETEIKAFASKHFTDSMRKLILSAVTERAHKAGINKIEHMNVEFKAKQNLSPYRSFTKDKRYNQDQHHQPVKVVDSNGKLADTAKGNVKGSDIPLPAHYVDTYHEGPQKAGFERDQSTGRWVKFSRKDTNE